VALKHPVVALEIFGNKQGSLKSNWRSRRVLNGKHGGTGVSRFMLGTAMIMASKASQTEVPDPVTPRRFKTRLAQFGMRDKSRTGR